MENDGVAAPHGCSLIFQRIVLILLTAWALANIMPALYRVVQPLASFGLSIDNDGLVIDIVAPFKSVRDSPAARAGVALGDRVDLGAMRCLPEPEPLCVDGLMLTGGLGGLHYVLPGSRLTVNLLPRAEIPSRILTIEASRPQWDGLESFVLLADTLTGIAVVLIACALVWRQPSAMTWGFFLFTIWFNPGQTYTYYALLTPWPLAIVLQEIAEAAAQAAAMIGLIIFALRFPHNATEPEWRPLIRMLPAMAAGLFLLNLAAFGTVLGLRTQAFTYASYFAVLILNVLVLVILIRRRRLLSPQDDQRMRWVIAGCALGLPAFVIAELAQSAGLFSIVFGLSEPSQTLLGLIYLLYGVLAWFVSEAVRRPRIISVAVPLRHGTIMALLSLLIAVPIFHLHEWVAHHKDSVPLPEWAWLLVAGPLMIIVLQHLHEGAVHLADHLFSRRYHRAQHCLSDTKAALHTAQSFDEIDRHLVDGPCTWLRLASGAVFHRENGDFRLRPGALGWLEENTKRLSAAEVCTLFDKAESGQPVRLAQPEEQGEEWPSGLARPCLAVPVRGGPGTPLALSLYGAHQTGTDLDGEERLVLRQLGDEAGNAYERVEIEALRREVNALRARLGIVAAIQ